MSAAAVAAEGAAARGARPAIRVRHLWHRYGGADVLRDVTFDVAPGEIFGFIGPNGAGKTTTIRVMATLIEPMAGRVEVDGHDVTLEPEAVRRVVGYMPDHAGVYDRITIREYLEFFAEAFRVGDAAVVDAVLELTDLGKLQDRLVATLSKGMKQRLQLARILLHDPKILILDEPASDLDPRARIEMRDLLLELRGLGKTIFLSSHILTELADVCTSVAILERGRLVVAGPIHEIARRLGERAVAAEAQQAAQAAGAGPAAEARPRRRVKLRVIGDARPLEPLLRQSPAVLEVQASAAGQALVTFSGGDEFLVHMVRHLVAHQVPLIGVEPERTELERIFLEATRGDLQ
ncbi:MAG TPA: ABC transporter ATP-binding protein [Polyangiaceae bacterium]|nr:ABC transporter ATP-binding protein [Polyangiaceae bacterium]